MKNKFLWISIGLFIILLVLLVRNVYLEEYTYLFNKNFKIPTKTRSVDQIIPNDYKLGSGWFGFEYSFSSAFEKDNDYFITHYTMPTIRWDIDGKKFVQLNTQVSFNINATLKPSDMDNMPDDNQKRLSYLRKLDYVENLYVSVLNTLKSNGFKERDSRYFQKDNLRCIVIVPRLEGIPYLAVITIACSDTFEFDTKEQLLMMKDFNLNEVVIEKLSGNFALVNNSFIAKKQNGHWRKIIVPAYESINYLSCADVKKYNVPEEIYDGICN